MVENNCYDNADNDDEGAGRWLKRKRLDIKAFEINSCRNILMRSVEDPNVGESMDNDYLMFLKRLLSETEPSSSLNGGDVDRDEEDDADPQYMMFLKNLKGDGQTCKLEFSSKNGTVSAIYWGEDDSDDEYGKQAKVIEKKNLEIVEFQNLGNNTGREGDAVMEERCSKVVKYMGNCPSRDVIVTRRSPRIYNVMIDSGKNLRENTKKKTQDGEGDLKALVVKEINNLPNRMEVKTHTKNLRNSGRKHVENTRKDIINRRGRRKGKSTEEKILKAKGTNDSQQKTSKNSGRRFKAEGDGLFGPDFQQELDENDIDECYREFLNSLKLEDSYVIYANQGKKLIKLEEYDVECSSDSDILVTTNALELNEGGYNPFQTRKLFVTPNNQQLCVRSCEGEIESNFRKKLMAKVREPYDDDEYLKLWDEINEEKPKLNHYDLRGSGVMKQFASDERSPSYLATYAPLKKKIAAACHDRQIRLNYMRAFFFWLQNVAYEDAFQPWHDKSCLEMMENHCQGF